MDTYQEGFKAGYRSAQQFYGLAARERLDRIAEATRGLRELIAARGGCPPAELMAYLDEVTGHTTADTHHRAHELQ
ncbi:hypothetical protein H5398_15735 [Tessaracoccus sp. MC1679]|uniref:hypothetical protein n=1 Tax=Tessaracoccus sp. MC1679 TaxID=2760313 RepID=UPI0015FF99B7|nr:hypothetical protein [Tessaracoccus sp. MC1679]MBB1517406.1 hypothetical protein [Tessaracoccus sp. MC1679]